MHSNSSTKQSNPSHSNNDSRADDHNNDRRLERLQVPGHRETRASNNSNKHSNNNK